MNSKLIPISELSDNIEFYRGTRFRLYNIGLNVEDEKDDFYEYMLALIPGENHMLLTCVEGYKSGSSLALVKKEVQKEVVTAKSIKFSMGIENVFLIK